VTFSLNELLETTADRSPESVAVVSGDVRLTYGELELSANRLANAMLACKLARGDRVGIHLTKSAWSVVALHAIHKAGAVYVPIDPHAPVERVRHIVQAAGIRVLVTELAKARRLADTAHDAAALDAIIVTDDAQALPQVFARETISLADVLVSAGSQRPDRRAVADDLAYILFTSGSTGRPKGVMISHSSARNFVDWAQDTFDVNDRDVVANHAPLHFDLSVFDVFASMKAGATVMMVPEDLAYFPYPLAEWIEHHGITIWYSVPSILAMLVRQGHLARFRYERLRTILFAGEVFPVKHLRQLAKSIPHVAYYNLYGPTETNVITYYRIERSTLDTMEQIPIGKACANTEVFLVDASSREVRDQGIESELFASGKSVAAGYWGNPEATAQAFVVDPRNRNPQTVYRTGDIAKRDTDGNLIFIGRRDDMVKSRGYRIELGEIESVIHEHPHVLEAAVIAIADDMIGNRIKAFAVPHPERALTAEEVRRHCSKYLPKYMVPEAVEMRASLPRTSTGKIDKTALRSAG
jgi:amino acid adenylation domain-containing protein